MKLTIINGSPRGKKSNSKVIAEWIKNPISNKMDVDTYYAAQIKNHKEIISSLENNQTILIVFPLYTDSVPYVLKVLLEEMDPLKHKMNNINIYYVVHSGFMGGAHCRAVEKYLVYFSKYMGFNYCGTAIKPSSEGLRMIPEFLLVKTRKLFEKLSIDIISEKPFNKNTLAKLIPFETPKGATKKILKSGVGRGYFNSLLKHNGSYAKRYDRPYEKNSED